MISDITLENGDINEKKRERVRGWHSGDCGNVYVNDVSVRCPFCESKAVFMVVDLSSGLNGKGCCRRCENEWQLTEQDRVKLEGRY